MRGICAIKAKAIASARKKVLSHATSENIARALGISARGAKYWLRRSDKYQEIIQDIPPNVLYILDESGTDRNRAKIRTVLAMNNAAFDTSKKTQE